LVLAWLYSQDSPVRLGLDTFHHLAAVRELGRGEFPPRHNLVEGYVPQGHYGPYLVAVARLARLTGASARAALHAAGLAGLVVFGLLVASHPLSGLAMASALGALIVADLMTSRPPPARVALLATLPVLALGLAALWPYYPLLKLLKAFTMPQLWEPPRAASGPGPVHVVMSLLPLSSLVASLRSLGPAVAGLAWCAVLAVRRQPCLLLWAGLDLMLAASPLPFHQRFLVFALLPLQIAATGLLQAAWRLGLPGKALAVALLA